VVVARVDGPLRDYEQLVLGTRRGDQEAAQALFERYRDAAYRIAYYHVGRAEDALDVVQEAFIKALNGLPRLKEPARFRSWLLRIVTNQARDLGRRHRRQDRLGLRAAGTDEETGDARPQAVEHTTPAQEAETRELARGIQRAIGSLEEHHREVLLLISQGGLSYREVAEELDIPIGTVMSRLHYGRRAVRDWLSQRGYL